MGKAKKLIDKIKASEKDRKNLTIDETLSFKDKCKKIRKSVTSFMDSLTIEEIETLNSNEFYDLHYKWKTNSEPKTRYEEYHLSPEWKTLKTKVIKRAKYTCEGCGEADKLEVHHLTYERIGEELMIDLVALCFVCHKKAHNKWTHGRWHTYIKNETNETV